MRGHHSVINQLPLTEHRSSLSPYWTRLIRTLETWGTAITTHPLDPSGSAGECATRFTVSSQCFKTTPHSAVIMSSLFSFRSSLKQVRSSPCVSLSTPLHDTTSSCPLSLVMFNYCLSFLISILSFLNPLCHTITSLVSPHSFVICFSRKGEEQIVRLSASCYPAPPLLALKPQFGA